MGSDKKIRSRYLHGPWWAVYDHIKRVDFTRLAPALARETEEA